ncbi:hypothetical protein [Methylobacterium radiotolerans]|uniref:hypothetical protein n=1 Tax=Methylobacterium radiotolerans TaxID=31998 RepID=UPI001191CB66|nr:hypothetical protein [Methylobacterium radiotolerans]GEN01708.1 hypothetical protein MRA01_62470 [Methylobacterium radiotolerans]
MSRDAVEIRILEAWPSLEEFAYRHAEAIACTPEVAAILPTSLYMRLPAILASKDTIAGSFQSIISSEFVSTAIKDAALIASLRLILLEFLRGRDARELPEHEFWKLTGEVCEQIGHFDLTRAILLGISTYNDRHHMRDMFRDEWSETKECFQGRSLIDGVHLYLEYRRYKRYMKLWGFGPMRRPADGHI